MTDIIDRTTESRPGEAAPTPEELTPYVTPLPIPPVLRPGTGDVLRETEIALRADALDPAAARAARRTSAATGSAA